MYRRPVLAASGVALFLSVVGCDKTPKLPTIPAGGTVTYNGAPVANAQVGYYPADPESGRTAVAETDASGRFTLKTPLGSTSSPGAMPGEYKVTVLKMAQTNTVSPADMKKNPAEMTPAEQKAMMDKNLGMPDDTSKGKENADSSKFKKMQDEKAGLPKQYADPTTTTLKATVKAGDKNEVELKLTD